MAPQAPSYPIWTHVQSDPFKSNMAPPNMAPLPQQVPPSPIGQSIYTLPQSHPSNPIQSKLALSQPYLLHPPPFPPRYHPGPSRPHPIPFSPAQGTTQPYLAPTKRHPDQPIHPIQPSPPKPSWPRLPPLVQLFLT